MKVNKLLMAGVFAAACYGGPVSALPVSSLSDIEVGGTLYDVTFWVRDGGYSFDDIWGATGVLGRMPAFWNNTGMAVEAARSVAAALGTTDTIRGLFAESDSFVIPIDLIPFSKRVKGPRPPSFERIILTIRDWNPAPGIDDLIGPAELDIFAFPMADTPLGGTQNNGLSEVSRAYASFAPSSGASVPEPASLALVGIGLLGMMPASRWRRRLPVMHTS